MLLTVPLVTLGLFRYLYLLNTSFYPPNQYSYQAWFHTLLKATTVYRGSANL